MKVVWALNEATVRQIYDALHDRRPVAYTTVMTVMRILEQKGHLKKALIKRAHVYKPARPRQQVVGAMVRDFLDRVFDGAPDELILHLAKADRLTKKQKQVVRQLAEDIDR